MNTGEEGLDQGLRDVLPVTNGAQWEGSTLCDSFQGEGQLQSQITSFLQEVLTTGFSPIKFYLNFTF